VPAAPRSRAAGCPALRLFPPGSEWLYAKLYTAPSSIDGILRVLVRPLVDEVLGSHVTDGWFFIRYGDPYWHVRLRFHGDPARLHAEALPRLQERVAPFLASGRVWKLQLDTYEREIERYGGPHGIELAERLFQADSEAVLAIVEGSTPDEAADRPVRWALAITGMDRLLNDLGFDLPEKLAILKRIRRSYGEELRVDVAVQRRLGEQFRQERASLAALLDPSSVEADSSVRRFEAFRHRSERLAPLAAELRAAERDGRLTVSLAELAPSYLHMHANRLLRASPRSAELVLYDFLLRLYESQAARAAPSIPADSIESARAYARDVRAEAQRSHGGQDHAAYATL
jgi:thiopeptide-type bacteriocin biosynthesis protein